MYPNDGGPLKSTDKILDHPHYKPQLDLSLKPPATTSRLQNAETVLHEKQ